MVPNSLTLNDFEWRDSPNICIISPNSVAFVADYIKVVEDRPYFLQQNCSAKNVFFALYRLWRYSWRLPTTSALCIAGHITSC